MNLTRKDAIWSAVTVFGTFVGFAWEHGNTESEQALHVATRAALHQQADDLTSASAHNAVLESELNQIHGLVSGWNKLTAEQREFFRKLLLEEKELPPVAAPQLKSP